MQLEIHINFRDNCKEAFEFYAAVFGVPFDAFLTYGDSPQAGQVNEDQRDKIVHAGMDIGNVILAGADVFDAWERPAGFQILLQFDNEDEARKIFNKIAEGGEVIMSLQETFWSPCYGLVRDKYDVPWEINCSSQH